LCAGGAKGLSDFLAVGFTKMLPPEADRRIAILLWLPLRRRDDCPHPLVLTQVHKCSFVNFLNVYGNLIQKSGRHASDLSPILFWPIGSSLLEGECRDRVHQVFKSSQNILRK
jgi:hypothetical protein